MELDMIASIVGFICAFIVLSFIWNDVKKMEEEEEKLNEIEDTRPTNQRAFRR